MVVVTLPSGELTYVPLSKRSRPSAGPSLPVRAAQFGNGLSKLQAGAAAARGSSRASRATRARRRAKASANTAGSRDTYLQNRSVSASTSVRYRHHALLFEHWCKLGRRRLGHTPDDDQSLAAYMNFLFFDGGELHEARYAMYGYCFVHRVPTRGNLWLQSKAAMRGWQKASPEAARDPMPWLALLLLLRHLVAQNSALGVRAALALLLSFDGYLRPGEACSLEWNQLIRPRPQAGRAFANWSIIVAPSSSDPDVERRPAKSGQFDDTVIVGDRFSELAGRHLVRAALDALPSGRRGFLLDLTVHRLDSVFIKAVAACQLGTLQLVPHCARHGGASEDYAGGVRLLPAIQRHGRWMCKKSVTRYEKSGRLQRQVAKLSADQIRQATSAQAWLQLRLPAAIRLHM